MKNILIVGVVLISLIIGWFILNPDDANDYVVMFEDEVAALEAELLAVEEAVNAGTLTPEAAAEARGNIITRLNAAQAAAAASEKAKLTPAQREQLMGGLEKLKTILTTYLATLVVVEEIAAETEEVQEERRSGGSDYQTLTLIVAETVESVEETVQDSVQEYESDSEFTDTLEEIIATEEEVVEEIASTTEAMIDEEESTQSTDETSSEETEEEPVEMGMPIMDSDADEMTVTEDEGTDTEEEITQ